GARLLRVHPRVAEVDAAAGGAGGEAELEALGGGALAAGLQLRGDGLAHGVEEDGVFGEALGEDALRQAGDEDHVQVEPARVVDGADEDVAGAALLLR